MRSWSRKPRVMKSAVALALALEQRVGGDGGAHLHRLDPLDRDGRAVRDAEQLPDARDARRRDSARGSRRAACA